MFMRRFLPFQNHQSNLVVNTVSLIHLSKEINPLMANCSNKRKLSDEACLVMNEENSQKLNESNTDNVIIESPTKIFANEKSSDRTLNESSVSEIEVSSEIETKTANEIETVATIEFSNEKTEQIPKLGEDTEDKKEVFRPSKRRVRYAFKQQLIAKFGIVLTL